MNHLTINVHLDGTTPPRAELGARSAHVTLGDWQAETVVYAMNPAHLLAVAEAFTDAARRLSDELDRQGAAAVNAACTRCSRALDDEDPSNTGLGYHVDCTADGVLAGQPA